jgi:integrase/recombinase XerD
MNQLRLRISRLIETGSIADNPERERLQVFLNTKRFNPYCLRHSSISHDSDYLPENALKKKVQWSMNSKQPSRYIKSRMGNNLKEKILMENGIISDSESQKSLSVLSCPRCSLINAVDSKYCSGCSYPLTAEGYEEIKAAEDMKLRTLEQKYEQEIKSIREQMNSMFDVLHELRDQKDINIIASTLYRSGQLKIHQKP